MNSVNNVRLVRPSVGHKDNLKCCEISMGTFENVNVVRTLKNFGLNLRKQTSLIYDIKLFLIRHNMVYIDFFPFVGGDVQ